MYVIHRRRAESTLFHGSIPTIPNQNHIMNICAPETTVKKGREEFCHTCHRILDSGFWILALSLGMTS